MVNTAMIKNNWEMDEHCIEDTSVVSGDAPAWETVPNAVNVLKGNLDNFSWCEYFHSTESQMSESGPWKLLVVLGNILFLKVLLRLLFSKQVSLWLQENIKLSLV